MPTNSPRLRNGSIQAAVLRYLDERVRLHVYLSDMAKDLNLSNQQITHSIHGLRKKGLPITSVAMGVYVYNPKPQAAPYPNPQIATDAVPTSVAPKAATGTITLRGGNANPAAKVTSQTSVGRMFEQIATTKAGKAVIQDEDGNLYLATELD